MKELIIPIPLTPYQKTNSLNVLLSSVAFTANDASEEKAEGEILCLLNGGVIINDRINKEKWYLKPEFLWEAYKIARELTL